eukprot:gb/GECG01000897.1/.p1 GENE.gb/GECG01000897.1/~~gb/GECG01000897.1/.p1  ORF type:complete len:518 (+),score=44.88 gb/GECG01000897.1/:1-1554(+)
MRMAECTQPEFVNTLREHAPAFQEATRDLSEEHIVGYLRTKLAKTWLQISDSKGERVAPRALRSFLRTQFGANVRLPGDTLEDEFVSQGLRFLYYKGVSPTGNRNEASWGASAAATTGTTSKWRKLRQTLQRATRAGDSADQSSDDRGQERGGRFLVNAKPLLNTVSLNQRNNGSPVKYWSRALSKYEMQSIQNMLLHTEWAERDDGEDIFVRDMVQQSVAVDAVHINAVIAEIRPDIHVVTLETVRAPALVDLVTHRKDRGSASGIDNTGNVRIWPAEEWLAILAQLECDALRGLDILEIGAGYSGLASGSIAVKGFARSVTATDGNVEAAANLRRLVAFLRLRQELACNPCVSRCILSTDILPWKCECAPHGYVHTTGHVTTEGKKVSYEQPRPQHFDLIVCADCLFFEDFHEHLCSLLYHYLRKQRDSVAKPQAWLLAPSRGGSRERFIKRVSEFQPHCQCRSGYEKFPFSVGCEELEDVLHHHGVLEAYKSLLEYCSDDPLQVVKIEWSQAQV